MKKTRIELPEEPEIDKTEDILNNLEKLSGNVKDIHTSVNKPTDISNKETVTNWFDQFKFDNIKAPQAPQMATGGETREREFIVGDSKTGEALPTEEKIINPTGAPLTVVPKDQWNQATGNIDQIKHGVDTDTKKLPHFAFGTGPEQMQAMGSAGGTTSGAEVASSAISSVGNVAATAANFVLPGSGIVVQAFAQIAQSAVAVVSGFNQLTEHIAKWSGQLTAVTTEYKIKEMEQEAKFADKYGGDLADIYETTGDAWLEVKEAFLDFAMSFKNDIMPLIEPAKNFIINVLKYTKATYQVIKALSILIADWMNGNFKGSIDKFREQIEAMLKELNSIKNNTNKENLPFNRIRELQNAGIAATMANRGTF